MAATKKNKQVQSAPRTRKVAAHRSFHLTKKRLMQRAPLTGGVQLLKNTVSIIRNNKKLFIGIALIHAVLSFLFVQGLGSAFDLGDMKGGIEEAFGSDIGRVTTSITLFGYLLGSTGSGESESAGVYQMLLAILTSLAAIWAVRQVQAGERPRIRDTFYRGMYPLVPFVLILIVMGLQLLPLLIGNLTYSAIMQNGLAVTSVEKAIWLLLFLVTTLLSFYMIISSCFALYISTLPDMTPLKALRSARELVLHRRLAVGLRLIVLPIVTVLLYLVLFIPLLMFAPPIVIAPLFILATSLTLVAIHIYLYSLYRSLL